MSHHLTKIFDVWGGNAEAMATDIEEPGVTVRQWRNRGRIHSDYWPKIIGAAAKRGKILHMEDFYPPDVVSALPGHAENSMAGADIGSGGNAVEISGTPEADSHRPFVPSSSTCSTIPGPSRPQAASAASSIGEATA